MSDNKEQERISQTYVGSDGVEYTERRSSDLLHYRVGKLEDIVEKLSKDHSETTIMLRELLAELRECPKARNSAFEADNRSKMNEQTIKELKTLNKTISTAVILAIVGAVMSLIL